MAKPKAPENETAADRFKRIANGRHRAASKAIDGLGKLVGSTYAHTEEQRKKVFSDLRLRLDRAENNLAANKESAAKAEGIL